MAVAQAAPTTAPQPALPTVAQPAPPAVAQRAQATVAQPAPPAVAQQAQDTDERAAPTTVGPLVITVPQGFVAAQTQKSRKTFITAWTKSVKDGSSKTYLQVTILEQAKPGQAEKYLQQELATLERRRANYSHSPVAHLQLAGSPAVRATWNGNIGGYPVMGVLYSVIIKDRYVVKILAQDLGTTPTDGLFEAMQAIESIGMS